MAFIIKKIKEFALEKRHISGEDLNKVGQSRRKLWGVELGGGTWAEVRWIQSDSSADTIRTFSPKGGFRLGSVRYGACSSMPLCGGATTEWQV